MRDARLKYVLVLPAVAVVLATMVYPLAFSAVASLHKWRLAASPRMGAFVGGRNYADVGGDPDFFAALWRTLVFVAGDVAGVTLLALGLALLLRRTGALQSLLRAVLILPFAMSPALIGISWRFFYNPEYGVFARLIGAVLPPLRDTVWLAEPATAMAVVISADVWHWTPYMALVILGGLAAIPAETEEAARIDGASDWQVFKDVVLPQLAPVLGVVVVTKAVFAFKTFDEIYTVTQGGPGSATEVLSYYIYRIAFIGFDMGYASALSYVLTALLLVVSGLYFGRSAVRRRLA